MNELAKKPFWNRTTILGVTLDRGALSGFMVMAALIGFLSGGLYHRYLAESEKPAPPEYHYEQLKNGVFTNLVRIDKSTGKTEILKSNSTKWEPR